LEARCIVCGKRPASLIKMERHVGMVVWRRWHKTDGPFCQEHALATARQYLGRTLLAGWWSPTSFVYNFKAVAVDAAALRAARQLPPPDGE